MFKDSKNDLASDYPIAYKPQKVGEYDALTKSGGGYFYDEVLEYRVWLHPELGAEDIYDGEDYFCAFPTYELAQDFHINNNGSEKPLVLILQREWIDEPEVNVFIKKKGKRITEWRVDWLENSKRDKNTIDIFIQERM